MPYFYIPGEADGISRNQYSPFPPPPPEFLYPNLTSIDFLPSYAPMPHGPTLGFLKESLGSLEFLRVF